MALWSWIKDKLGSGGERVVVIWSRDHHVEFVPCVIDPLLRLVRSGAGQSWPRPSFDPTPDGKATFYLAAGDKIIPWPTREKPAYDVMDDGTRIEITPEYLDQLTRDSDTEAWLRGARGMSVMDRLMHLGAGAALGMVLTFFLLKLVGFVGNKVSSGSGTTVTISNTTANATAVAPAIILHALHVGALALGGWSA
ncbi:MAG: hypothetical protein QOE90_2405 [Thermoplasmata archaeon]|jgi:hypothetical protein|nr:hypothetical protein [Thermoplasmata archaeon]